MLLPDGFTQCVIKRSVHCGVADCDRRLPVGAPAAIDLFGQIFCERHFQDAPTKAQDDPLPSS